MRETNVAWRGFARRRSALAGLAIVALLVSGCTAKPVEGAPETAPHATLPSITASATTTTAVVANDNTPSATTAVATPPVSVAPTTAPPTTPAPTTAALTTSAPPAGAGQIAVDVLGFVVVEKEHPAGYARDLFGYPADLDGDQCDTRSEVLQRDSITAAQIDPFGCTVVAGDWVSAYDGVAFTSPGELEIDHVVSLKEAWDSGAWAWSAEALVAYANDVSDMRTLGAVSVTTNRSKGDRDPSNWLPPDSSDVCSFISDWVSIKARWGLSMDESEFGRIGNLLRGQCVGSAVAPWSAPGVSTTPVAPTPPAPLASIPAAEEPVADVYYANCTAARAAGAAPIYVGDPGYRSALDRDKDGVACE